jgi:hypothetical protein
MALGIASIIITDFTITVVKAYDPFIHDFTCDELQSLAQTLNLKCLSFLNCAEDCIFNDSQRDEILKIEIPLMRKTNLSKNAQEALDGLEFAIKDMNNPYGFLLLEGE